MEVNDLRALSVKQVAAMTIDQIAAITPDQMSALTADKIVGWTAAQKQAFVSPLALDLNDDGINTLSLRNGVAFDVNNDAKSERTGWIASQDALLVRDLNRDGTINNGGELFGEGTVLANGRRAKTGYEALAALDSNLDGVIDKHDGAFSSLLVWQDKNSNGISEAGELRSLSEVGITELSLQAHASNKIDNGNLIGLMGTFATADGKTHTMGDVWFSTDQSGNKTFDLNKLVDKSDSSPSRGNRVSDNNIAHLPNLQLDDVLSTSADSSIQVTIDTVFSAHVDSATISSTSGVDSAQYSLQLSPQTLLNEKTQTHWGSWL
jgi:hypothetical protein